jgi:hypothetical protein
MILINMLFIVALFGVWVWTLKQDIEHLKRTINQPEPPPLAVPAVPGVQAHVRVAKPAEARPHLHPAYDNATKTRNRNGIPTWTIA